VQCKRATLEEFGVWRSAVVGICLDCRYGQHCRIAESKRGREELEIGLQLFDFLVGSHYYDNCSAKTFLERCDQEGSSGAGHSGDDRSAATVSDARDELLHGFGVEQWVEQLGIVALVGRVGGQTLIKGKSHSNTFGLGFRVRLIEALYSGRVSHKPTIKRTRNPKPETLNRTCVTLAR